MGLKFGGKILELVFVKTSYLEQFKKNYLKVFSQFQKF